jgi:predicted DCC family thiol-disulfide oxidoreductase YuxK
VTDSGRIVVLYDRDCEFCRWSLERILAWDRGGRLAPVPIQSEEGDRLLASVDPRARLASWHLVTEDGRLFSGGAAAEPLARRLSGGRPLAAVLRAFPATTERVYAYVAAHRARWSRLLRLQSRNSRRR